MKYITDDQIKIAAKLWEKGAPMAEIAKTIGSSASGIEQALKRKGFTGRPKPIRGGGNYNLTQKQRKEIARLYKTRIPMKEIQIKYNIGPHTIYSILRQLGVERNGSRIRKRDVAHGAKRKDSDGYIVMKVPNSWPWLHEMGGQGDGSWKFEHRIVMAEFLKRALLSTETVHHRNGDKADNRIENLQLINGNHIAGHATRCRKCGSNEIEYE